MRKSILAFSIVAALSGCGGGGDNNSNSQPATGTPSTPTTPPVVTTDSTVIMVAPAGNYADADRLAAYNYLNTQRVTCGFGALAQSAALDRAAQAHADFVATNVDAGHPDAYSHTENASYPGFTGALPIDRANSQGYGGVSAGENLAAEDTALLAAKGLLTVAYHTLGTLRVDRDIGLGISKKTATFATPITVVTLGLRSSSDAQYVDSKTVVTFPCDGQSGVTTTHFAELPNPLPGRDLAKNPAGRPIIVKIRAGQTLSVSDFSVATAGGTSVKATLLTKATDPNQYVLDNEAVLIPDLPLTAKTTYTAKLVGTNNGQPISKTWSFTTQ